MSKKTKERRKRNQIITRHHRKCISNGGSDERKNISYVTQLKHRSWHNLFSNHTAEVIARIINQKWIDPDYEFICRKKN